MNIMVDLSHGGGKITLRGARRPGQASGTEACNETGTTTRLGDEPPSDLSLET